MTTNSTTAPGWATAARVWWMLGGPMLMVMFLFRIVERGESWFTSSDLWFMALVASMAVARWLEFLGGAPQTAGGFPAQPRDLRQYVVRILLVGAGIWLAANLLANVILQR